MQIDDYPMNNDENFYREIYLRKEFYDCRYTKEWWTQWTDMNKPFKHLPHQRFVYNYISPSTPYMNLFLYHGCGSGKSDCAYMIVESNKLTLDEHNTSAIFLAPNELVLSSILSDLIGKEVMPDGTIRFKKKGTGDRYIDANIRKYLNEINDHEHTSDCMSSCQEQMHRKIKRVIQYIKKERLLQYYTLDTQQRFAKYINDMPNAKVTEQMSNRIIIIDEIHKIRNQTRLYEAIQKIATYSYNTKLVFMSGTPRVDREYEMLPIINLLRINDKYLKTSELLGELCIKQIFNRNPYINQKAELEFAQKIKGYVSFIRGTNPITFPIRKEIGTRMIPDICFNTVECFLKGKQLITYLNAFFDEFNPNIEANITNELWEKTRCASRCAFENTKSDDWLYKNIGNISCKFEEMWKMFQWSEGKGAILIYAFNIDKGINLVERFLIANGIEPLSLENANTKGPKFINFSNTKNNELNQRALDICKSHDNYQGEYIKYILGTGKIRTGITFRHLSQVHIVEPDWNIPTTEQTVFRGARQFSHFHPDLISTNRDILVFRYRCTFSEKAILELPVTMKKRYDTFLAKYETQLQKRGFLFTKKIINNNNNDNEKEPLTKKCKSNDNDSDNENDNDNNEVRSLMTIDDYMYVTCLRKDVPGSKIDRLSKIYAADAALQIHANYFPDIEDSTFDYTRVAHYDKMEYPIPVPSEHELTPISQFIKEKPPVTNNTTYELRDWVLLVPDTGNNIEYINCDIFDYVLGLFSKRKSWRFKEILQQTSKTTNNSVRIVPYILDWLLKTQYRFFNTNDEEGYIIYASDVYLWNPIIENGSEYERKSCNLFDIVKLSALENNNYQTKYLTVQSFLNYDDLFKDIYDEVIPVLDTDTLYISKTCDKSIYTINKQLVIELVNVEKISAVYDNTKDNPNDFNMKLWYGTANRIAASSRKLGELKKLCATLDITLKQHQRKNEVCEMLRDKLIETHRMLPWAPNKTPSLYRLYQVSKVQKIDKAIELIITIVNDILKNRGQIFINPVIQILQNRIKTRYTQNMITLVVEKLEKQFIEKAKNCPEYILALIERMYGARPVRLKPSEWTIITQVYTDEFYQIYKNTIANIFETIYNAVK